jgi:predicted nucleic acid-binding protein
MLIAATAEIHRRTLVTRSTRDFKEVAIPLLDPFS